MSTILPIAPACIPFPSGTTAWMQEAGQRREQLPRGDQEK
jgi:hypothetical protein